MRKTFDVRFKDLKADAQERFLQFAGAQLDGVSTDDNLLIMFSDLIPLAQQKFLDHMGLQSAAEGNYDTMPIAEIPKPSSIDVMDESEEKES